MHCEICRKSNEEAELFEGISQAGIIQVCDACAEQENIPLIKKPTSEQIDASKYKSSSVRERMENLSAKTSHTHSLSPDQRVAHKNLAKLRLPPKKQYDPLLVEDYYWKLQTARRRKKITIPQLAAQTGISEEMIEGFEKAQLPANFEGIIMQLEAALGIRVLKSHNSKMKFERNNIDYEKEILERVGQRVREQQHVHEPKEGHADELLEQVEEENRDAEREKQEKVKQFRRGELDLSKRQNLQDITLSDLVRMKKEREKRQKHAQSKQQEQDMFGEEIDLDEV